MKTKYGNSDILYFSSRQNLIFLSSSLSILWIWMLLCVEIDRNNDRGFITIVGMSIIMSTVLSIFFSKNIVKTFFTSLFRLLGSTFLIFVSFILGVYISAFMDIKGVINLSWTGLIIPFTTSSTLIYLNLRQLFSFQNNCKAFLIMLLLPILTTIIINSLPFYDDIIAHDLGIGFPISIYISLVFITISVLCRQK